MSLAFPSGAPGGESSTAKKGCAPSDLPSVARAELGALGSRVGIKRALFRFCAACRRLERTLPSRASGSSSTVRGDGFASRAFVVSRSHGSRPAARGGAPASAARPLPGRAGACRHRRRMVARGASDRGHVAADDAASLARGGVRDRRHRDGLAERRPRARRKHGPDARPAPLDRHGDHGRPARPRLVGALAVREPRPPDGGGVRAPRSLPLDGGGRGRRGRPHGPPRWRTRPRQELCREGALPARCEADRAAHRCSRGRARGPDAFGTPLRRAREASPRGPLPRVPRLAPPARRPAHGLEGGAVRGRGARVVCGSWEER